MHAETCHTHIPTEMEMCTSPVTHTSYLRTLLMYIRIQIQSKIIKELGVTDNMPGCLHKHTCITYLPSSLPCLLVVNLVQQRDDYDKSRCKIEMLISEATSLTNLSGRRRAAPLYSVSGRRWSKGFFRSGIWIYLFTSDTAGSVLLSLTQALSSFSSSPSVLFPALSAAGVYIHHHVHHYIHHHHPRHFHHIPTTTTTTITIPTPPPLPTYIHHHHHPLE